MTETSYLLRIAIMAVAEGLRTICYREIIYEGAIASVLTATDGPHCTGWIAARTSRSSFER
jgi:hypothetical protein